MNVSIEGPFRSLRSPLFLKIRQRIGIKVRAENTEPPFGDAWILEAPEFVTQRAIAPLRRVEVGEPPGWIRCPRGFSQGNSGSDGARPREDERRDMGGLATEPAPPLGLCDHRR